MQRANWPKASEEAHDEQSDDEETLDENIVIDKKKHLKRKSNKFVAVAAVCGGVGAVIAAPFVISAIGFGAGGIAAGSWAASLMSSAAIANGGGVAAGSAVALLQSAGVVGTAISTKVAIAGAGSVITGAVASRFK